MLKRQSLSRLQSLVQPMFEVQRSQLKFVAQAAPERALLQSTATLLSSAWPSCPAIPRQTPFAHSLASAESMLTTMLVEVEEALVVVLDVS